MIAYKLSTIGIALSCAIAVHSVSAQNNENEAPKTFPSPNGIVESADTSEWIAIKASDLMVMDLEPDRDGKARRVIIQLMPKPFSQGWIRNIRKLAAAKFWDDTAIIRVQDNYVTQWGDPNADEEGAKALPDGLEVIPESEYEVSGNILSEAINEPVDEDIAITPDNNLTDADFAKIANELNNITKETQENNKKAELIANISMRGTQSSKAPFGWHDRDSFAEWVEIYKGWPIGNYLKGDKSQFWPVHCYGMVGVGRNLSPDTGDGSSLYTVIGHAPRHLDRNIALVGRIISGMEHMSSLARGTGTLGFYESAEEHTKIVSVRMGSEVSDVPNFEYLDDKSLSFARYVNARANRRDPFFNVPAGGADICNITVPIRQQK